MTAAPREAIGFILELGRALHSHGYTSHRLEDVLTEASAMLGLEAQFFATPTSLFASFGADVDQRTHLIRVEPGAVDLGALALLDAAARDVLSGSLTPAQGAARVREIINRPPPYGRLLTIAAFGLASAAACRFFGGGLREIGAASVVGVAIGVLAWIVGRNPIAARVFEPLAAFTASALTSAIAAAFGGFSLYTATLAGLIVLVPGLTLTTALTDLASRHLASGTARLSEAFIVFLSIAFGVALGARVVASLAGAPPNLPPTALPAWTEWAALVAAPLAFTILLRAQSRDAGWIVSAGALAYFSVRAGAGALGPELGGFVGACVVGVASNLFERATRRPAAIPLVPGVLLLVPGSIGYRSISALIEQQVVTGVEAAFTMILTAVGLAAGLLVANVIAPPARLARTSAPDRTLGARG